MRGTQLFPPKKMVNKHFKQLNTAARLMHILCFVFLFSGLAGVICFLLDLQQPHAAKFPMYDILTEN